LTCGLTLRVTFAAVPIEPMTCCGKLMEFLGVKAENDGLQLDPAPVPEQPQSQVYRAGEMYTCRICGIEIVILRQAQPQVILDCCGEGMEIVQS